MSTATIDNIISLKQLREDFPRFIRQISRGESFTVVKRSKPIFQIGPISDGGSWQTIADFTTLQVDGVSLDEVLKKL